MGALIAYECCVRLESEGRRAPDGIIVSGHGAPDTPVSEHLEALSDDTLIARLVENGLTDRSMAEAKYRNMVKGLILDPL